MPFSDDQRDAVERAFAQRGYTGDLRVARVTAHDERVFVVSDPARAGNDLAAELQAILHCKVWIVPASAEWADTEPFA